MELLLSLSPILVLAIGALMLMLAEALAGAKRGLSVGAAVVSFAGMFAAIGLWLAGPEKLDTSALAPWLVVDATSLLVSAVLCFATGVSAMFAGGYLVEHKMERGEFYPLMLFATVGGLVLVSATDMLTLFLGLETLSLGVYAMVAFRRTSPRATEAALKYFLLGSFAAAVMIFGIAMLYGATGHTDFAGIAESIQSAKNANLALVVFSMALVLVGMAFKVSAVPFHMWTPDAYEGAPTPVTAYMAVVVKVAAFAALLRVFVGPFGSAALTSWGAGWPAVFALLALLTMTVSNLIAGQQESVKRMLAYSSIAHAGYLLVGVVATSRATDAATNGILFYLAGYTVATLGALGVLMLAGSRGLEATSYEDLAGLGKRHPVLGIAMSFFLLSLAGVPPLAGFFGKWLIFKSAIDGGFVWLTVFGLLNSVLGAYYYLRVMVFMYMREPALGAPFAKPMRSPMIGFAVAASAVLVLAIGLCPATVFSVASHAIPATTTAAIAAAH